MITCTQMMQWEIMIYFNGDFVRICEVRFGVTDLWIVPSDNLEVNFKGYFQNFYPMFFGMLLESLHRENTAMPIYDIFLSDINEAYENKGQLQILVDRIASGIYSRCYG